MRTGGASRALAYQPLRDPIPAKPLGHVVGSVLELAVDPARHERSLFADVDPVVADALERTRNLRHAHCPLASIGIARQRHRDLEHLAVESVDLVIHLAQALGRRHIPRDECAAGLNRQCARLPPHLEQTLGQAQVVVRCRRCEQQDLADVHALIAHALDAADHVEQRREQAQVGGDGRLPGDQREDLLVHLEEASVDAVVIGDDHVREREVAVDHDPQRAVDLIGHDLHAAQRALLERADLVAQVEAALGRHQPNLPATYCSVRSSLGLVKIFSVSSTSTSSPSSMNAVTSETRAACCMLCVTSTIVMRSFRSVRSSSILSVATGSRAEHGSSISRTSGCTASALAMHSRGCCPPESPIAGFSSLPLTWAQKHAPRSASWTIVLRFLPRAAPIRRRPEATLSKIDIVGNGFGRWKTIPIARRTATTSTSLP